MKPIKGFIDWYIDKFWMEDYVLKDKLKNLLIKTKENEANRLKKYHDQEILEIKNRLEVEKIVEVEELNAEVDRLNMRLEDMNQRVKQAEVVYFKAVKKAKGNARISGEMNFQAARLMELVAEISGHIQGIDTRAKVQVTVAEKEVKDVKKKLGI